MTARTVRLLLNYNLDPSRNDETVIEAWQGDALRVQFGIFRDSLPINLSGITSVEMKVLASQTTTDAPVALATLPVASMSLLPNRARWDSGAMQHGTLEFTATEMNLTVVGASDDLWYVISAVTTDSDASPITLGCGIFRITENNDDSAGSPPTNPAAGITQAAADARYLAGTANGINVAGHPLNKGGAVTLTNSTSSGTVTFGGSAFATAPTRVQLTMLMPGSSGAVILANPHTITTTGFSFELSGEVPASGTYKLMWEAIQ